MVLPMSTCEEHQKDTCRVEGKALRTWFGPARIFLGMPTRRPKERPETLTLQTERNGESRRIEVRPEKHPFWLAMWDFQKKPELLLGDRSDNLGAAVLYMLCSPELMEPDTSITVPGSFDSGVLSQLLAKVAHAYAVAELGHESFTPFLPELIFEKHKSKVVALANRLIGGINQVEWPAASNNLHEISLRPVALAESTYIVATVRLFAFLGTPIYEVVVGERPNAAIPEVAAAIHRR